MHGEQADVETDWDDGDKVPASVENDIDPLRIEFAQSLAVIVEVLVPSGGIDVGEALSKSVVSP